MGMKPLQRLGKSGLRLFALGYVHQHVDAADDSAFGIAQWRRIRLEPDARAIRPFGYDFFPMDSPACLESGGHRTFVVRHRRAVGIVELPACAPPVGSQLRL